MAKRFAQLQGIDNDHFITEEIDHVFLYHLQRGLLLALEERGRLSVTQYKYAEDRLKHQRRDRARKLLEQGADA